MSDSQVQNLIIGHLGQDGRLLTEQLTDAGESWFGLDCGRVTAWPVSTETDCIDITSPSAVFDLFATLRPVRTFYLAAVHRGSACSIDTPVYEQYSNELGVNVRGVLNCLEGIRRGSPSTRFVFAGSCLAFAPPVSSAIRINEDSQKSPAESYATEKLLSEQACADFRLKHAIHASVAFLFNHESPYRQAGFFSHHVTSSIRAILAGETDHIEIGDLDAVVDWSYAGDVVRALVCIADHDPATDFVVASGEGHTVAEFLTAAFSAVGLNMREFIRVNPQRLQRSVAPRIGDAARLRQCTGWRPRMSFEQMVTHLVRTAVEPEGNSQPPNVPGSVE